MSLDPNGRQLNEAWLRHHRILLGVASSVYLLWWFSVEFLLVGSFNPLHSRLAACSSFLVVLILSFRSAFIRRYIDRFYTACACALTLHFFYLFSHNPRDPNWIIGSYITVVAVGMTFERLSNLIAFTLLVLVSTSYVVSEDSSAGVVIPGMITVLVLLQVAIFLRSKADMERQRRIKTEAERASLEAISRAKSLFLANMSHELRTPLTSIIGFSEILTDAEELSDDSKSSLERIRVNSYLLMETVNQILNLTEDDFSHIQVSNAPFSVRSLLAGQRQEIEAAAAEKGIVLSIHEDEPFIDRLISDADSIGKILRNVLGNALKFTPQGQIDLTVSTLPMAKAGFVMLTITVRDSGIGIESADLDRVFEPFRQIQDGYNRPFGGTGLGLTIARKIARAMGGDVRIVESQIGSGTTVRITVEARTL